MEADEMQWYGLEIRPLYEFITRSVLDGSDGYSEWRRRHGISDDWRREVYLPLVTRKFRISRRSKKKELRTGPMFPGYVFAKLRPTDIWLLSRWPFVHGPIAKPGDEDGAPYAFSEAEIQRIKTIESQEYDKSVALVDGWAPPPRSFVKIDRKHHPMEGVVVQVERLVTKKGKEFWAQLDGKLYRIKTADVVAA